MAKALIFHYLLSGDFHGGFLMPFLFLEEKKKQCYDFFSPSTRHGGNESGGRPGSFNWNSDIRLVLGA